MLLTYYYDYIFICYYLYWLLEDISNFQRFSMWSQFVITYYHTEHIFSDLVISTQFLYSLLYIMYCKYSKFVTSHQFCILIMVLVRFHQFFISVFWGIFSILFLCAVDIITLMMFGTGIAIYICEIKNKSITRGVK